MHFIHINDPKDDSNHKCKNIHGSKSIEEKIDMVKEAIKNNKKVYMLIYMMGCGPCEATRPEWYKLEHSPLVKNLEGTNDIYVVDIDKNYVDKLSDVMDTSDISGFPTLRYIFDGKTEEFESSSVPKKSRETESFAAWTQSHALESSMHYEEESDSKLNNSSRKISPLTRASNMPPSSKSKSLTPSTMSSLTGPSRNTASRNTPSRNTPSHMSSLTGPSSRSTPSRSTSSTISSLTGPSYMTKRKPLVRTESLSSLFPLKMSSLKSRSSRKRSSSRKSSPKTNKNKTAKNKKGGKWSMKYKKSINCKRPRGFSQKQHCKYGRK